MSPDDSTGSAEGMALLGQYERLPNPTASDSTAALAQKSGQLSPQLEVVLSQCQTEKEIDHEMWANFEIHRRSADTYLNQYLDCLELVHAQRSRHVYEIDDIDDEALPTDVVTREPDSNATRKTREEWRLKVSHDSLVRDLLAMHETLEFLKGRSAHLPSRVALPNSARSLFPMAWSISASMFGCILLQNSRPWEALALSATYVAGVTCYYRAEIWGQIRITSIERYQKKIERSLQRLSRDEVDDRHRADLERESFSMLSLFRK